MMSPFRIRNIALLVIWLSLVATGLYWWQLANNGNQLRSETVAQAQLRARQLNGSVADQVALLMRYVDFAAQELAGAYALGNMAAFNQQVRQMEQRFPAQSLIQIGVIDASGVLVYSSLGLTERVFLGDRAHFKAHIGAAKPALFVSPPVMGRVSKQWSIQFSHPIQRHDRFDGVVVLSLSPDYLYRTLAALSLASDDSIAIFRQSGEYLARNADHESALGKSVGPNRAFVGPDAAPVGSFKSAANFDQVVRLFHWQRLSDFPIVVVLGLSETTLLKPVEALLAKNRWQALIATAVLWLLTLGAVLLLFRLGAQQKLIMARAEQLRSEQARLRAIYDVVPVGISLTNRDGRVIDCNPAAEKLLGLSKAEQLAHDLDNTGMKAWRPDGSEMPTQEYASVRALKDGISIRDAEMQVQTPQGKVWLQVSAMPVKADEFGVVVAYADITARKQSELQLRIAATVFEAQEGMLVTDTASVILRVNRAFTEITGYTAQEAVGRKVGLLKSGRHEADFYAAMWACLQKCGAWQGEIWNRRKNGEVFPEWLTITAVQGPDAEITHYVATLTDITLRKAAEDEVKHLAFYDPLTRLPNRRLLLDRLQQTLTASARSKRAGALLFIDLDNFKTLNDTLGHDTGDLLLQQVAKRLVACVREGDTVARQGGDEFVVILEELSENAQDAATQAKMVGEKILAALHQPYVLAGHPHHSTSSIGATLFNEKQNAVDDLMKRADLAMYQAKAAGRNTLRFFDPQMQADVTARATLEADLRQGLQQKEFLLHYQCQVDELGRITGAEALVRWRHPQRGLLAPAQFIALAEETGLILALGHGVLETACLQLVRWAAQPETAHLTMAVNVSARQFHQPDFVDSVLAVLAQTGANARQLKLELTESLLLDDVEVTIAKMIALKAQGVSFALDDFGTGFSSLSYLKRLPLNQLKIDQSFVRDILTDLNDAAITRTIVALADSMGLGVIAEGVETQAQRDFLAQEGCHTYQGYLFSHPVPQDQFDALLKRST